MNDFSELEQELKKLRPLPASAELLTRVEKAMKATEAEAEDESKIIRPMRFQLNWLSVGIAVGAAAALLIVARIDLKKPSAPAATVAAQTPARGNAPINPTNEFLPAGATQVVYRTQDEGLVFPSGGTEPVRRVRSRTRETLRWQNRATGASLRVSYPSEQIELIPVSGQ